MQEGIKIRILSKEYFESVFKDWIDNCIIVIGGKFPVPLEGGGVALLLFLRFSAYYRLRDKTRVDKDKDTKTIRNDIHIFRSVTLTYTSFLSLNSS